MTMKLFLLLGSGYALKHASFMALKADEKAPDDDEYDFADDDDDDPADFSVGQFLDDDEDAFIQKKSSHRTQRELKAPDDDEYDFAEDDDDDPSDFGVGQFLDDDDDSFIQLFAHNADDDYADDRLGAGEYQLVSQQTKGEQEASDDDDDDANEEDDNGHEDPSFLEEAQNGWSAYEQGDEHSDDDEHSDEHSEHDDEH